MNIMSIFSTSVFVLQTDTERIGRNLARVLAEERDRETTPPRSEGRSWESARTLHQRSEPCFVDLMQMFAETVQGVFLESSRGMPLAPSYKLIPEAWAVVTRWGEHVLVQAHPGAHFCGLYYADAGDSSGPLTFLNPAPRTSISGLDMSPALSQITPMSGCMLVFPAWLYHFHQPYFGDRPRVSIACTFVYSPDEPLIASPTHGEREN